MRSQLVTSGEVSFSLQTTIHMVQLFLKICNHIWVLMVADEELSADGTSDGCGSKKDSRVQADVEFSH